MRSPLFRKILISFVIVILVTTGVIGMVFANWVRNFTMERSAKTLESRAREVIQITSQYREGKMDESTFSAVLNALDQAIDAQLWIVDENGRVSAISRGKGRGMGWGMGRGMGKGMGPGSQMMKMGGVLPEDYLATLRKGEILHKTGEIPYFDEPVLYVGVPMMDPKEDSSFLGAVLLFSPVTGIQDTLKQMVISLLWILSAAILLSLLLGYYLSKSISQPLRAMSETAIAMAKGDFSRRISTKARDEVGNLGESLNYMAAELGKLDEMRSEYVANVSHELRTPLTSIQGFVEPLMDGTVEDEETRQRYYQIIHRETLRLSRLIKDLMDLSGLQSGNTKIDIEPMDIGQVLKNVTNQLGKHAQGKGVALKTHYSEQLPWVMANEDRIHQLLTIFMDNAIAFTPPGGEISLSAWKQDMEIYVSVKDTGQGISKEDLPHVWERFYKADKARRKSGGTGLGLSIAKQIIGLHGGRCWVESEPGRGSVFTFTLPIADI